MKSATVPSAAEEAPAFLWTLMRRGMSVMARMPEEIPERMTDPVPVPAWRRIIVLAHAHVGDTSDALLNRATRYVVLLPLGFRVVALPMLLSPFLRATGPAIAGPVLVAALLGCLLNLVAAVWLLRVPEVGGRTARGALTADAGIALVINMLMSAVAPSAWYARSIAVSWSYLVGSVALWTLAWGAFAGGAVVLAAVPLRVVMALDGGSAARSGAVVGALAGFFELVLTLVVAVGGLIVVGLGTRLALGVGLRRGRAAAHAETDRTLHDSVLQTLESMALMAEDDPEHAVERLAELRAIARAEAMGLRRWLAGPDNATEQDGLTADLAALATEMAREGLRAELVVTGVDEAPLTDRRRRAVRDAMREALRNTIKHAGATDVVVRVEQQDGGILVTSRDFGVGFDQAEHPPGFGIRDSITSRIVEVGGRALVDSRPGHGTRVTLWVPR